MPPPGFFRKRNRLPGQVYAEPGRFSLTLCTGQRCPYFTDVRTVRTVEEHIHSQASAHGIELDAYCFMPDHLHILLKAPGGGDVRRFVIQLKQRTAFWFRQQHGEALWQRGYYDHVLRCEEDTEWVAEYILQNPVRRGLCEHWEDYPHLWSRWHDRDRS